MGYTRHGRQDGVERFMRHYFLTVREIARLTRVVEPALLRAALGPPAVAAETDKTLLAAGFVLADGELLPIAGRDLDVEPIQMLRILKVARDRDLALHPLALRSLIRNERAGAKLRGDPEAADLFMDLLCGHPPGHAPPGHAHGVGRDGRHPDGARWLAILNEAGFLGRFLPDWGRIVGQMQFDTYHIFTVDEHTIEAIRVLNALERGELAEVAPVASGIVDHIQSRRALYLAMLMHDIAKGRGGVHSRIGAELALEVGPALGLSAEETETVSWLVLYHLLLSETAFKRDIDDPKTILDLADTIQSPERLRLLLILTVAEVRAGGLSTTERDTRVSRAKEAAANLLQGWSRAEIDGFLALGYPAYWLGFDPETHVRHAHMIRTAKARSAPLTVQTEPLPARSVTEVTVYTTD